MQCEAKTKNGKICKNHSMTNSTYCYIHSFGKISKVPWYKNLTIHSIIIGIFGILLAIVIFKTGPTKKTQEDILNNTFELKSLIKEVIQVKKENYSFLLSKYPSGFILLGVDYSGLITPPKSNRLRDYVLDWSNVNIVFLEDNSISFLLPDITYSPRDGSAHLSFTGIITKIPKGQPGSIYPFPFAAMRIPDNIYIEIISYSQNGAILCVGFRNKKLGGI